MKILAALLALGVALTARPASSCPTTVYRGAEVWTGAGFERRDLAVRDGRFVARAEAGINAVEVDLAGTFVVPAYGNAHAHVTPASPQGSWRYVENGVFYVWNPNTIVLGPEAHDFFAREDSYDVAVAQGGITEPGGHPEKLYVDILGPSVYPGLTAADFLGNAYHYGRDAAEIDRALDRLVAQRANFVKAYLLHSEEYSVRRDNPAFYGSRGLNPANFPYLVDAARRRGLDVMAHVETVSDLKVAAIGGAAVAAHLPGYSVPRNQEELRRRALSPEDARMVAATGMIFVPTYALAAEQFTEEGKKGALDRKWQSRFYAVQASNVRLLRDAGAKFMIGTDGPGPIFEEVEHLVAIGAFSAGEALDVALSTGRRMFPSRRIGCFDPGCEADFLVLTADPTRDVRALRAIRMRVKAGRLMEAPPRTTRPLDETRPL